MRYYLLSLGCQMNISDSERVQTVLQDMGFEETKKEEEADLLGIMACSVRQKAIDRVYSLIHKWNMWKKKKHCITFISGCVLPSDREKFLKKFDILFSINELTLLPSMLQQYGVSSPFSSMQYAAPTVDQEQQPIRVEVREGEQAGSFLPSLKKPAPTTSTTATTKKSAPTTPTTREPRASSDSFDIARGFWNVKPRYSSLFDAYVTIQNGCDKFCTFCAVPYTRGREVSRASSEILREVYELMKQGYKTITLLGQNVNSYGLDFRGTELSFSQLLERIGNLARELQHKCWVYFTSPHPRDMNREVLEVVSEYPCFARQIHLPLQSGDDKLLFRMNRNHSVEKYRTIVDNIRILLPEATLFTDIIVGFCGETEQQFQNTKKAMEEFQYNMAYIAIYSPRPGAASYRWQDSVPHEVKKQRFRILTDLLHDTAKKRNTTYVGKTLQVLVESLGRKDDTVQARSEGRIPVILQSTTPDKESLIGTFVPATITGTQSLSLMATMEDGPLE